MVGTDVVLGVLASASTAYGFVLAYYVFARGLHASERDRYEGFRRRAKKEDRPDLTDGEWEDQADWFLHESMRRIFRRSLLLDRFLLGATFAFALTAIGEIWYLANLTLIPPVDWSIVVGGLGLVLLFSGMIAATSYIGYKNHCEVSKTLKNHVGWLQAQGYQPPDYSFDSRRDPVKR